MFKQIVVGVDEHEGGRDAVALAKKLVGADGVVASLGDVGPHAAYGHPAEELALYSASLDLLVVGSRGYGPIGRLIHGSTSHRLAHSARCPLLVLPRAACLVESPQGAAKRQPTVGVEA